MLSITWSSGRRAAAGGPRRPLTPHQSEPLVCARERERDNNLERRTEFSTDWEKMRGGSERKTERKGPKVKEVSQTEEMKKDEKT